MHQSALRVTPTGGLPVACHSEKLPPEPHALTCPRILSWYTPQLHTRNSLHPTESTEVSACLFADVAHVVT
jgi:hypothetical protein